MAKVTFVFEDLEDGNVFLDCNFSPDFDEWPVNLTNAQDLSLRVMNYVESLRNPKSSNERINNG